MSATGSLDFEQILLALLRHGVRFIVVGGVCGALHGSPVVTLDLDVVHARDTANIDRLLSALEELDAVYRIQPERKLRPSAEALMGKGHHLLITRHGPMDILGMIGHDHGYDELLPHTVEMHLDNERQIDTLDLRTLIRVKEETAGAKDAAALAALRQILAESEDTN